MPDAEEQLRLLRTEEKAARDDQVAYELEQDDRLAATLAMHQSKTDPSAKGGSPLAS